MGGGNFGRLTYTGKQYRFYAKALELNTSSSTSSYDAYIRGSIYGSIDDSHYLGLKCSQE
jgi:hypothetical protein